MAKSKRLTDAEYFAWIDGLSKLYKSLLAEGFSTTEAQKQVDIEMCDDILKRRLGRQPTWKETQAEMGHIYSY